jgi:hypothetical protein
MKNKEDSIIKEELNKLILLINYDVNKTLDENKKHIDENEAGAGAASAVLAGVGCGAGVLLGLVSFGAGALAAAAVCATAVGLIHPFVKEMNRTDEPSKKFQIIVNSGKALALHPTLPAEVSPGFDAKSNAKSLYDAMFETFFGSGIGTNVSLINSVFENVQTVVDLYYLDKEFQKYNEGPLSENLQSELETAEWVPIIDKVVEIESKMKAADAETKKRGQTNQTNQTNCFINIQGMKDNRAYITLPSENDDSYCWFMRNKGTNDYSSGTFVCKNNRGKTIRLGVYSCSTGSLRIIKNQIIKENEYKNSRILSEVLVAGISLDKNFENRTTDSGGGGGTGGGGTEPPKPKKSIPNDLGDRKGVEKFQDWLDTHHSDAQEGVGKGWATGYTGGKVDKGKGYGRFGPRTEKAWNKYKTEYLNQENKNQEPNKDYQLDQTADKTTGV